MSGRLMRAEMSEQPRALGEFVERFDEHVASIAALLPDELAGVTFVARGSSDHAAVFGRYLAELASGRPAALAAPSLHTLYRSGADYRGWLVVALSQSGKTPEIATVTTRLREAGAQTVAIVNEVDSPVASAAELAIPLAAGVELATPATKTVTTEFLAVAAVAAALGPVPFGQRDLEALPDAVAGLLDDGEPAALLAQRWAGAERAFVTARGLLLAAALECALKIKETTGMLAEGISSADLRHGPIAASGPAAPVLVLDGGGPGGADLNALAALARARGAPVARCAPGPSELPLPAGIPEALAVITTTVRGQQLALELAEARGLDPDAPAGLTKVTATN